MIQITHTLVLSAMSFQPRPFHRNKKQSAKLDVSQLREECCNAVNLQLDDVSISDKSDPGELWNTMENGIHSAGLDSFEKRKTQDPDWCAASIEMLQPVVEKKREALLRMKSGPIKNALNELGACCAETQHTARECAKKYRESLCAGIESARDKGNSNVLCNQGRHRANLSVLFCPKAERWHSNY